jgi:small-conductance mechanosensitive channel
MDMLACWSSSIGTIIRMCLLCIAFPIVGYMSAFIRKAFAQRFSQHIGVLVGHIVFYGGLALIGVNILHEFGFNVTALLGAAGVIGIAVGFASQTSISNIISGFFLLIERPFSVGDLIKSGDITGIAESIDLLAVRVRTQDNKLVRIPNEMVLKHSLVNVTHYGVRRIDLLVSFPYEKKIDDVTARIISVITQDKLFLTHPTPLILMNKVGQLDYDPQVRNFLSVRVWVAKEQFSAASSILIEQLKNEFDTDGTVVTIAQLN